MAQSVNVLLGVVVGQTGRGFTSGGYATDGWEGNGME